MEVTLIRCVLFLLFAIGYVTAQCVVQCRTQGVVTQDCRLHGNTTNCVLHKNYCQEAVFVEMTDHVTGSIDVSQCTNLRKIGFRQNNDLTCKHIKLHRGQTVEVVIQNGTSIACTVAIGSTSETPEISSLTESSSPTSTGLTGNHKLSTETEESSSSMSTGSLVHVSDTTSERTHSSAKVDSSSTMSTGSSANMRDTTSERTQTSSAKVDSSSTTNTGSSASISDTTSERTHSSAKVDSSSTMSTEKSANNPFMVPFIVTVCVVITTLVIMVAVIIILKRRLNRLSGDTEIPLEEIGVNQSVETSFTSSDLVGQDSGEEQPLEGSAEFHQEVLTEPSGREEEPLGEPCPELLQEELVQPSGREEVSLAESSPVSSPVSRRTSSAESSPLASPVSTRTRSRL